MGWTLGFLGNAANYLRGSRCVPGPSRALHLARATTDHNHRLLDHFTAVLRDLAGTTDHGPELGSLAGANYLVRTPDKMSVAPQRGSFAHKLKIQPYAARFNANCS